MARSAVELLQRVERGEEKVITSSAVIFEVVFTLQRFYSVPRYEISQALLHLLSIRGLELDAKGVFERALHAYAMTSISFADAYNAAFMENRGVREIYTWDRDFDRIPDVVRVEPS
jgi:predicted nucleic acid-binding protein